MSAENMHLPAEVDWRRIVPSVYGDLKSSAKRLMRDAGCSERAARTLLAGGALPSTPILFRLMQANASVFDAVCEATGRLPGRIAPDTESLDRLRSDLDAMRARIDGLGR